MPSGSKYLAVSRFTPNHYFQSRLLRFSGVRDPSPFRLLENVDDTNKQIVFPFLAARLIKCPSCLRKRVYVPSLFQRTALTFKESPLCTPVYRFLSARVPEGLKALQQAPRESAPETPTPPPPMSIFSLLPLPQRSWCLQSVVLGQRPTWES